MESYFERGQKRAYGLGNRGKLEFNPDGSLTDQIKEAYWHTGFYIFEDLLSSREQIDLKTEFESLIQIGTGTTSGPLEDNNIQKVSHDFDETVFSYSTPLSDPFGGTSVARGRYQAKMKEYVPPADSPEKIVIGVGRCLEVLDSFLRLYGHPKLLKVAEDINGRDFVPFRESIWVKPAGLGTSTAWHQDGTTHWDNPELDAGTHGFNFMAQLYPTNPVNALWIVPGTHDQGKINIKKLIDDNRGSDQLPGAVPMLCQTSDVAICNRQLLHAAFPNVSDIARTTLVFGFHRRNSVLGVLGEAAQPYSEETIRKRARVLALAIDARNERYPEEFRYLYRPLEDEIEKIKWNEAARNIYLKDYTLNNLGI